MAGLNGPQPLGSAAILAWSQATGTILRPDEIGILRDMDTAFLNAMSVEAQEHNAKYQQTAQQPQT